ncbi:uncharacterized protein LOC131928565 isoform X2 [Physella acuta]|uniref:uncharacterized protein LOC131928565 isoform X2 n=1 Tax=Physella acuta TaxID=109671 RepID=UPI0027DE33EF|nr:uncharacterized protein LOC131928565 isoform X2 [Physella acuta]
MESSAYRTDYVNIDDIDNGHGGVIVSRDLHDIQRREPTIESLSEILLSLLIDASHETGIDAEEFRNRTVTLKNQALEILAKQNFKVSNENTISVLKELSLDGHSGIKLSVFVDGATEQQSMTMMNCLKILKTLIDNAAKLDPNSRQFYRYIAAIADVASSLTQTVDNTVNLITALENGKRETETKRDVEKRGINIKITITIEFK